MRKSKACFAAGLLLCAGSVQAAGNINGTVGVRQLDKDQWSPNDQQLAIGVISDFSLGASLPLYMSFGAQVSVDESKIDGDTYTGSVVDVTAGLKLMPRSGTFRPYVQAGIATVGAAFEFDSDYYEDDSDNDGSIGYYAGVGAIWRIGRHFNLGADVRWLGGTSVELFGYKGDVDSLSASVVIGYGWD
jgi:hypothetical protein